MNQNLAPLSRLGRIWSILESQVLGGVIAYKRRREEEVGETKMCELIHKRYFDFRVVSLALSIQHGLLLIGSHLGKFYY